MIEAVRRLVSNLPDRSNSIESQVTALYNHLEAAKQICDDVLDDQ
ncbi:hypothetical protein [Halostagnicola bangensis]